MKREILALGLIALAWPALASGQAAPGGQDERMHAEASWMDGVGKPRGSAAVLAGAAAGGLRAAELEGLRAMAEAGPQTQAAGFTGERIGGQAAVPGSVVSAESRRSPLKAFAPGASLRAQAAGPRSRGKIQDWYDEHLPESGTPGGLILGLGLAVVVGLILNAAFPAGISGGAVLGIVLGVLLLACIGNYTHGRGFHP